MSHSDIFLWLLAQWSCPVWIFVYHITGAHNQYHCNTSMRNTVTHQQHPNGTALRTRGFLKRKPKKVFLNSRSAKKTTCGSYVQPWLVALGGWWLVAIGGWQLATGGWWRLAVSSWSPLAVGGWRLVAVDGWRLVVPWGGP